MVIFKIAVAIFAFLLMAGGLAITPTPLPFGLLVFLIGFLLLASVAPSFVRSVRRHWRWFDRRMHQVEKMLPEFMARRLRNTDYDHETEERAEASC